MIQTAIPYEDIQRLSNLKDYKIMDTPREQAFDDITLLASEICEAPVALISFIDDKRQWFKATHGLEITETPIELSFCTHTLKSAKGIFVVPDARKNPAFTENPLVTSSPNIVFYAGIPLISAEGNAVGALCVIDFVPRKLNQKQTASLKALGRQVTSLLELRKSERLLKGAYSELIANQEEAKELASTAAHDLRSPLHNIISLVHFFMDENAAMLNEENLMYLNHVMTCSYKLSKLIDGMLEYERTTRIITVNQEAFDFVEMIRGIIDELNPPAVIKVSYPKGKKMITTCKPALLQILSILLESALLHQDKPNGKVNISFAEDNEFYRIGVSDNGSGIAGEDIPVLFNVFQVIKQDPTPKTGIAFPAVSRLTKKMGGTISVDSKTGKGATISFTLKKI